MRAEPLKTRFFGVIFDPKERSFGGGGGQFGLTLPREDVFGRIALENIAVGAAVTGEDLILEIDHFRRD